MIRGLCWNLLKWSGWSFVNQVPDDLHSFVMIGAPHTSNIDFLPAMSVAHLMKRNARFVIKKEWLAFPLNYFFEPLGAIGVDRKASKEGHPMSYTDSMAGLFSNEGDFVLMIAPEGTRSPNPQWKTGFYYIAQKAGVPIVLAYADFKKKEIGLGKVIYPKNLDEDMKEIMSFYQDKHGRITENFKLDEKFSKEMK